MLENKDIDNMGNLKGEKGIAELKECDRELRKKRGMKRTGLTFAKLEINLNSSSTT